MPYSTGPFNLHDTFANMTASGGSTGILYFAQDTNLFYQYNGSAFVSIPVVGAPRVNGTASSATPSINVGTTDQFEVTALTQAITGFTLVGTPSDGQPLAVRIKGDATPRAITWGASFISGPAALITTTGVSKTHLSRFIYDSVAAKFVCILADATGY